MIICLYPKECNWLISKKTIVIKIMCKLSFKDRQGVSVPPQMRLHTFYDIYVILLFATHVSYMANKMFMSYLSDINELKMH